MKELRKVAPWLAILGAVAGAYALGVASGQSASADSEPEHQPEISGAMAGDSHAKHGHGAKKPSVWSCSMHAQIKQGEPGKCPICGMDLSKQKASKHRGKGMSSRITITEHARAKARIKVMSARRHSPEWIDVFLFGRALGTPQELDGLEGSTIQKSQEGRKLMVVELEAYPADLERVELGRGAFAHTAEYPDSAFHGIVTYIADEPDEDTGRTTVRAIVSNRKEHLKKGAFVNGRVVGRVGDHETELLMVPRTSVLFTGRRSIVYVELPESGDLPAYEARVVDLGELDEEGWYPVYAGLKEYEQVVMNGTFVLDAEAQIRGKVSMVSAPDDLDFDDIHELDVQADRMHTRNRSHILDMERETLEGFTDARVETPAAYSSRLEDLTDAYLAIHKALSSDDMEAAKIGAKLVLARSEAIRPKKGEGEFFEAWYTVARFVEWRALEIEESEDIDGARVAFGDLSKQMISVLRMFGNHVGESIHLAHCPMALKRQGASWIQLSRKIENPYFGAKMFKCGMVKEKIATFSRLPSEPETFEVRE